MTKRRPRVGIIGFGSFGELTARVLADSCDLRVYARRPDTVPENLRATLEQVCTSEYVVLCVPLASYNQVIDAMVSYLPADAVIVDICSVKLTPMRLLKNRLPRNRLVATHPLFGPDTAGDTVHGHTMVVCDDYSEQLAAEQVVTFCRSRGIEVVRMTAEEHDRQMAKVHALTFFIAEVLDGLDLANVSLATPSYRRLLSLAELHSQESQALLDTIQLGNPFAAHAREQFVSRADELLARMVTDT